MATMEEARAEARTVAEDPLSERFLERLMEGIGAKATVRAVYGQPIERDGLTVIPVARVRWGFGGGSGTGTDGANGTGSGTGGGGGATVDPLGHLELRGGEAVFRPILAPYPSPTFLLAAGVTAALIIRALGRVLRG